MHQDPLESREIAVVLFPHSAQVYARQVQPDSTKILRSEAFVPNIPVVKFMLREKFSRQQFFDLFVCATPRAATSKAVFTRRRPTVAVNSS